MATSCRLRQTLGTLNFTASRHHSSCPVMVLGIQSQSHFPTSRTTGLPTQEIATPRIQSHCCPTQCSNCGLQIACFVAPLEIPHRKRCTRDFRSVHCDMYSMPRLSARPKLAKPQPDFICEGRFYYYCECCYCRCCQNKCSNCGLQIARFLPLR